MIVVVDGGERNAERARRGDGLPQKFTTAGRRRPGERGHTNHGGICEYAQAR
jgi:hypothetical protein